MTCLASLAVNHARREEAERARMMLMLLKGAGVLEQYLVLARGKI